MAMAAVHTIPLPLISSPRQSSRFRPQSIRCGPRDNRGKLQRGRTLSNEAILAVQSLKRTANVDANLDAVLNAHFSRLLKSDLLAALAELQRQNRWQLSLKVFAFARREPWYKSPDFALYAGMIATLARCGVSGEIDAVVTDLVGEKLKGGAFWAEGDVKGVSRVVRALLAAERGDLAMVVYREMRRGGCDGEEELFKFLSGGLRRLGLDEMADEVWRDFKVWDEGGFVSVDEPASVR